jgi:hypothetical protein
MRPRASGALITSCQSMSGPLQFQLLKTNPQHPSLHFKRVGRFHSARVGAHYRTLAVDAPDGILWFWIGSHAEYDRIAG